MTTEDILTRIESGWPHLTQAVDNARRFPHLVHQVVRIVWNTPGTRWIRYFSPLEWYSLGNLAYPKGRRDER